MKENGIHGDHDDDEAEHACRRAPEQDAMSCAAFVANGGVHRDDVIERDEYEVDTLFGFDLHALCGDGAASHTCVTKVHRSNRKLDVHDCRDEPSAGGGTGICMIFCSSLRADLALRRASAWLRQTSRGSGEGQEAR